MQSQTPAKTRLASILERLEASQPDLAITIREIEERLFLTKFNVVVTGAFKRGKSSLVNALLGEPVLPTGVLPLTSLVTELTGGDQREAEVWFESDRKEGIAVGDLRSYVTEAGNPGNRKAVRRVLVRHPSSFLADGIYLIDTPGIGSTYTHNTQATLEFLPQADALIFVTAADPPISEEEIRFLRDARSMAAKTFVVMNKADQVDAAGLAEVRSFISRVIEDAMGEAMPIYTTTLVTQSVSGLGTFAEALQEFLARGKGEAAFVSALARSRRLVAERMNSLAVVVRAAELSSAGLERRAEEIERLFERFGPVVDETSVLLGEQYRRVVSRAESDLDELRTMETRTLLEFVRDREGSEDEIENLEEAIQIRLRADIDRWIVREEVDLGRQLEEGVADATGRMNAALEDTFRMCGAILGVELTFVATPDQLPGIRAFDYSFEETPGMLESFVADPRRYLPETLRRRRVLRRVRARTPGWVDKHCGRIHWDLSQRLAQSLLETKRSIRETAEGALEGLRRSLRDARDEDRRRLEGSAASELAIELTELRDIALALESLGGCGPVSTDVREEPG